MDVCVMHYWNKTNEASIVIVVSMQQKKVNQVGADENLQPYILHNLHANCSSCTWDIALLAAQ